MDRKSTDLAARTCGANDTGSVAQALRAPPQAVGGIAAGSIVLTLDGALPVEHLAPGDRIVTRSGSRVLRSLGHRVIRGARAIRIGASTLGPDHPQDDVIVAPGQQVLVRDWRAAALCGAPSALVEARRLTDGEFIRAETVAELRLFTLDLGAQAVIYVNGLELGIGAATVPA